MLFSRLLSAPLEICSNLSPMGVVTLLVICGRTRGGAGGFPGGNRGWWLPLGPVLKCCPGGGTGNAISGCALRDEAVWNIEGGAW